MLSIPDMYIFFNCSSEQAELRQPAAADKICFRESFMEQLNGIEAFNDIKN